MGLAMATQGIRQGGGTTTVGKVERPRVPSLGGLLGGLLGGGGIPGVGGGGGGGIGGVSVPNLPPRNQPQASVGGSPTGGQALPGQAPPGSTRFGSPIIDRMPQSVINQAQEEATRGSQIVNAATNAGSLSVDRTGRQLPMELISSTSPSQSPSQSPSRGTGVLDFLTDPNRASFNLQRQILGPSPQEQLFNLLAGVHGFSGGSTPESQEFRRRRRSELQALNLQQRAQQQRLLDQLGFGRQRLGIEGERLGLQGQQLGINERQIQENLNDISRLLGLTERESGLTGEEFDIRRGQAKQQAATQERGLRSQATARGATVTPGTRAGLSDISAQLASQLGLLGIGEERQQMGTERQRIGLQEQRRSAEDERRLSGIRREELNLRARELGIEGDELRSNIEEGLRRSQLDTYFSANDILDQLANSRGQDRLLAERIYQQVLELSPFYQNPQGFGTGTLNLPANTPDWVRDQIRTSREGL